MNENKENKENKESLNKKFEIKGIKILLILILVTLLIGLSYGIYIFIKKSKPNIYPKVEFSIKGYGNVVFELDNINAPNTTANFLKLVDSKHFDSKILYGKDISSIYAGRNMDGSAPKVKKSIVDENIKKGTKEDTNYQIDGEFLENGYNNPNKHKKYTISMLRANYTQIVSNLYEQSYNSGDCMFNIIMKDSPSLDGKYAVFGRCIKGFEILDKIFKEETKLKLNEHTVDLVRRYKKPIIIERARVLDFGYPKRKVKYHDEFIIEKYIENLVKKNLNSEIKKKRS